MFARFVIFAAICLSISFFAAEAAQAENQGQEDLIMATEAKLSAESYIDLSDVIRLCQSALKKGLDQENTLFAHHLLAATYVQRAEIANQTMFTRGGIDPRWLDYRRQALDDLEKAVELVPDEPEALLMIAKLNFLPGGDKRRAEEVLDRAIDLKEADTRLRATALLLRAGRQRDAKKRLADLDEALRIEPKLVSALRARGTLYAAMNQSEEALRDLEAANKIAPNHPRTVESLALVLSRLKKFDQALEQLEKLQKNYPKLFNPLLIKARIYAVKADTGKALECLNKALEIQPDNLDVIWLRANLYVEMKQVAKALADADHVLQLKPDLEKARRMRAMLLAQQGKFHEVVDELETILQSTPGDMNLQLQLGIFYAMLRKHQAAIDVYAKVLSADPKNIDALLGRAGSLLAIGKHAESIADYHQAVQLGVADPGTLNNFAWVLATSPEDDLRDGKRAVQLATKACEATNYDQPHILSTLAAAYAESGDYQSAVKWSKKALQLSEKTGNEKVIKALAQELDSFENGKPWREKLSEEEAAAPEIGEKILPDPTTQSGATKASQTEPIPQIETDPQTETMPQDDADNE